MERVIKLIGITGPAQAGKTTAASYLVASRGYMLYSLAWPIKRMLSTGLGLTDEQLWGDEKETRIESIGKSPRQLMQSLGTEWGREVYPDIWLSLAIDHWMETKKHTNMVIPDIRFENEAEWIRGAGGTVVHIARDAAAAVAWHSSESGITFAPGDRTLPNNGTITEMKHTIDDLFAAGKL